MLLAVLGLLLFAGAVALFWALLPSRGQVNRWATMPILESVLPLLIIGGGAIGLSLIFSIFVRT
jgi:hypothetical protein